MIELHVTPMSAGEVRTYWVDYTKDLPSGVTVSSATGTLYSYPSGGTATLSVGVISAGTVPLTITPTSAGQYTVGLIATLSDAEKSEARLYVTVEWQSSRATARDLIASLRGMTETTVNDWSVGAARYWSDYQLQEAIDRHAQPYDWFMLTYQTKRVGSGYEYYQYWSGLPNWELSPVIMDADAGTISSGYTFDAARGLVTFSANQAGSARFISGTAYDLNAAAADIWRAKAAHYASAYDVSTDNHNLKRSQLIQHCQQMASMYSMMGGATITVERGDC